MLDKRRILVAGGVLIIAAATGHVMQYGGAFAAKFATGELSAPVSGQNLVAALPAPPSELTLPRSLDVSAANKGRRIAAVSPRISTGKASDFPTPSFFTSSCDIGLRATPAPGAMVRLALDAPCYQNQRFLVSHAGLEFAEATDIDGSFVVSLPVMDRNAPFSISFADGNSSEIKVFDASYEDFHRVAISWKGGPGLHINALEFGAEFGDSGHVWVGAQNGLKTGVPDAIGELISLGNPDVFSPQLAEVYSFPSQSAERDGVVRIIVEAAVTPATCGNSILGNTLQIINSGRVTETKISLTMPECSGDGGFLVLNNLLQDMKITQN